MTKANQRRAERRKERRQEKEVTRRSWQTILLMNRGEEAEEEFARTMAKARPRVGRNKKIKHWDNEEDPPVLDRESVIDLIEEGLPETVPEDPLLSMEPGVDWEEERSEIMANMRPRISWKKIPWLLAMILLAVGIGLLSLFYGMYKQIYSAQP